jgi:hypothetical protein
MNLLRGWMRVSIQRPEMLVPGKPTHLVPTKELVSRFGPLAGVACCNDGCPQLPAGQNRPGTNHGRCWCWKP